jgi:hypothetical protein
MRFFEYLLFAGLAAASAVPRQAPPTTPKKSITIEDGIKLTGSACEGTTDIIIGEERETVTFGFNDATIALGDGLQFKECRISMNVKYPPGCFKANLNATHHGFAEAKGGGFATLGSVYTLSSSMFPVKKGKPFQGKPFDIGSDFVDVDTIPANLGPRMPRTVNISVRFNIGVAPPGKENAVATMALDHLTLTLANQEACPNGK